MQYQASCPTAWRFTDLLDIAEIQRLQDTFAEAHQVTAVITDPDGNNITRISRQSVLAMEAHGRVRVPPSSVAARLDTGDGAWAYSADIDAGGQPLAAWRLGHGPDLPSEQFARICGFLQQAAELVSHQARMAAELRRLEAERDSLSRHLQLSAGTEVVGRLASGVAHDFGNLMTAVIAYAEQLADRLDDPEDQDEPAVCILGAAERATALVHRLLDVVRHRPGCRAPVDLALMVDETASLLDHTLPGNIHVAYTVDGRVRPVEGDAGCLHAALLNLGINAGHAMPDGGELTLSVCERDIMGNVSGLEPGPHVVIRVQDTGEGMDQVARERIFDPFYTTRSEGTGLGLTQVRGCIESHGGAIEVVSEPGRGTVFTVMLPVSLASRRVRRAAG